MKMQFTIAAIATSLLCACGGGGSSSDTPQTTSTDPIDKYVGTWKGTCDTRPDIFDTADSKPTSVVVSLKFSKLTSTTANTELTTTVYASSDAACSGSPIGSIVKTGMDSSAFTSSDSVIKSSYGQNIWTYSNNVTLAAGQKVDQISSQISPFSTISNLTLTSGRVKVNTSGYGASSIKGIAYFVDDKTVVLNTNDAAQGFPTAVSQDKYSTYTKQ